MIRQVQNVIAAVEKLEIKIAAQAITIGPRTGIVILVSILKFLSGFLRHPRSVSAGSSGIR